MEQQKSGITFNTWEDAADERRMKADDDSSISSTEEIYLNTPPYPTSHFIIENIRFSPKVIEFNDAFQGKQFAEKLVIQNVGRNPVHVKIGEPRSFIFQLKKPTTRVKFLPAGASITKIITYTYHNDDLVQRSQIPVYINGFLVAHPIVVKRAEPEIEVYPPKLNFEIINLGASAKSMSLTIRNTGGKRTKFEIDCGKHLDLVVNPTRGTVKPKHSVDVCVEIMGFREGEYYRELWIKATELPIRVPVLVEVVRPRLEIQYPMGTENFTLINFRPTFVGTERVSSFVLKNVSNEISLFVVLAEVDGKLVDLSEAKKLADSFNMFTMSAQEGCLAPFESRIFNVKFCPKVKPVEKGWHHLECMKNVSKGKSERGHIAFIYIQSVYHIDRKELEKGRGLQIAIEKNMKKSHHTIDELESSSHVEPNFFDGHREERSLRFCLHGRAIDPDILIQPSSMDFGEMDLGQTESKVLRITNNSIIGVRCKLLKTLNVVTKPQSVWLKGEKVQEFLVNLTPRSAGSFKLKMKIEIFAESDGDKGLVNIAVYSATITYKVRDVPSAPAPKVGLGITPLVVDEVGPQKDLITYKDVSKLPRAAVLDLKEGFKPAWMKKEKDQAKNVDNALVALPNDRPRLFHTWPKDKVCRSIFKGFFRYSPPEDLAYTLSLEGRIERKERRAVWAEYISRRLWQLNHPCVEGLKTVEKHFSCLDQEEAKCRRLGVAKLTTDDSSNGIRNFLQQNDAMINFPLIPLSPLFLYLIKVDPKLINFGMVAVDTETHETVSINNQNSFPIKVKFSPGNSNVSVMKNGVQIVLPRTTQSIDVFFRSKEYGRYFGFLNFVINGAHEFKITISAFVTSKTLFLNDNYLSLEFKKDGPKDVFHASSMFFPLENLLQCPVKYTLHVLEETAMHAEITSGEMPPRTTLLSEIHLKPAPGKSFYSELSVTSESGHTDLIKVSCPFRQMALEFLKSSIDMHDIPLNLPTKVRPILVNTSYQDVFFQVINVNPMPGVVIIPKAGIIKARSFFYLEIIVKIPVPMKFSFIAELNIHYSRRISMSVTGNVVFPVIRIVPSEVNLRKICGESFDTFTLCATNEGTTRAEMKIDLSFCPEFHVVDGEYEFSLPPYQSKKIVIRFDPANVARYLFYLPLIINQILGPPMYQEIETESSSYYISDFEREFVDYGQVDTTPVLLPCVLLNSTVTQTLLHIMPLNVSFRAQENSEFQPHNIEITNVCEKVIAFCINTSSLGEHDERQFRLAPVEPSPAEMKEHGIRARLKPLEKLFLEATFIPIHYGTHSVELPIYVKGYNKGLPYNIIQLCGTLEAPRIYPKESEVYFPPLPLGVACDVILTICAENYSSADIIKCFIWSPPTESNDYAEDRITTKWLTEPLVTGCETQFFQLQVTFRSSFPVAVKNYIVLMDSMGGYATVKIMAVADNSSVTVHSFLNAKSDKYTLIRDPFSPMKVKEFAPPKRVVKSELKVSDQGKVDSKSTVDFFISDITQEPSQTVFEPIEKGPNLSIHLTKSMDRMAELGYVKVIRRPHIDHKTTLGYGSSIKRSSNNPSHSTIPSTSDTVSTRIAVATPSKESFLKEIAYPNFPTQGNDQWNYFKRVISCVERWIFEVVMRCDRYYIIPYSFQRVSPPEKKHTLLKPVKWKEKDILHFLEEILGTGIVPHLPKRPVFRNCTSIDKASALRMFFDDVLRFLESKGCLLPHIKPEYLMEYDDYAVYTEFKDSSEVFSWDNLGSNTVNKGAGNNSIHTVRSKLDKDASSVLFSKDSWGKSFSVSAQLVANDSEKLDETLNQEKGGTTQTDQLMDPAIVNLLSKQQFRHECQILDKSTFESRSTQAWLDIVIQIFRVFILTKVSRRKASSQIKVYEMSDKKIREIGHVSSVRNYLKRSKSSTSNLDATPSNIYTPEERILLGWLNQHLLLQRDALWRTTDKCQVQDRVLNNFDVDLSDSVALISVTASYCPYIVSEYFTDVFWKPETPNKMLHNAARLIQAWRTLKLGVTVETYDIIKPNPVFMVMVLAHIYDVLPLLYPHGNICFSAPLNTEVKRIIQVRNESQQRLVYEAKFLGENRFFRLKESNVFEVKPNKTSHITVIYSVSKMQKISVTLYLSGYTFSPDFAKPLVFNLEGEPSSILEHEKMSFSAPLYKVICTEIPVRPPYSEPTTYEVWYTTKKPEYSPYLELSIKPWSAIWKTKVSRRLFLNKGELTVAEGETVSNLSVTVACLTFKKRSFWLIFRSEIGDFVVLVEISTTQERALQDVHGYFPEAWSPSGTCICPESTDPKFDAACPFFLRMRIPIRNDALWNALQRMFLKTLHRGETLFWSEHFEMDIGICLILWFLSPEEEDEVVDEFVPLLHTNVTYKLRVDSPFVRLPNEIEIPDVRKDSEIELPIHLSKEALPDLEFKLIMTSENKKEIRILQAQLHPSNGEDSSKSCL